MTVVILIVLCFCKVVSVSRTPGHTKHFQTIFLTPSVRLCDCPGLVFPSKLPKPLQVWYFKKTALHKISNKKLLFMI